MSLPSYVPLMRMPNPVEAFEAGISTGVPDFLVTSFKATLIREGSALIEGNFSPMTVSAGDLVLMRPGTRCSSVSISPLEIAALHIHPSFLVDQVRWARPSEHRAKRVIYQSLLGRSHRPRRIGLAEPDFFRLSELFGQLVHLSERPPALGRMITRSTELIWEIEDLLQISRSAAARLELARKVPSAREEVLIAVEAMHERYASDLSIGTLAREVSLSESAFRRAISAATGLSPRAYLHRIRLLRFEQLVADTDLPLAEITRLVGWSSTSYARTVFARSQGISPSAFRAEAQLARQADWLHELGR
ncbi:AraC family transcriptional regulator [Leucobacter sp. UCD-THU]|uniref:helix-turn-helix domain-containing protein n=1 Tax=Leucobacter sp. UCD-THU TaxID=1292023 RepID=UPI0009DB667E